MLLFCGFSYTAADICVVDMGEVFILEGLRGRLKLRVAEKNGTHHHHRSQTWGGIVLTNNLACLRNRQRTYENPLRDSCIPINLHA